MIDSYRSYFVCYVTITRFIRPKSLHELDNATPGKVMIISGTSKWRLPATLGQGVKDVPWSYMSEIIGCRMEPEDDHAHRGNRLMDPACLPPADAPYPTIRGRI